MADGVAFAGGAVPDDGGSSGPWLGRWASKTAGGGNAWGSGSKDRCVAWLVYSGAWQAQWRKHWITRALWASHSLGSPRTAIDFLHPVWADFLWKVHARCHAKATGKPGRDGLVALSVNRNTPQLRFRSEGASETPLTWRLLGEAW